MAKVFVGDGHEPAPQRDRRVAGGEEVVQSQQVRTLRHLSFDAVSSIQFCVDNASGLPISCTATRVTARLLSHDRSQIGEPSAPSYCDPDSECYAPKFDLHMGWRGNALQPTITIVCRVDTLERPSLLPKCVGFAVLKLCVDVNGEQPGPEAANARVFLNAGHFLLPVVYGRVPSEGEFSEALMDKLPHIHGAYLSVRLFDPSVDGGTASAPSANDNGWFAVNTHVEDNKYISESSVTAIMIEAFPYSAENIKKLPISEAIAEDIKKGVEIGEGEKRIVMRQLTEWMTSVFPPLKQKIPLIDPRFMLKYEDRIGAFCALDMLFNMPNRPELLRSTQEALGTGRSRGLFTARRFDNRIQYYKAYFRYLPGAAQSAGGKESIADLIIDDASLELDQLSQEMNPVFCDDFSRTVGIELTQNACLLVVVTAVDVLTSQRLALQATEKLKPSGRGGGTGGTRSSTSEEMKNRRGDEERAFKLKGLVGVYFGNDDPSSVWWGIVPLLVESPFQKRPKSGAVRTSLPVSQQGASSRNTKTTFGPAGVEDKHSLVARLNPWLAEDAASETKVRFDASAANPSQSMSYFVNAGTHQVPLFNGFPPEEMMKAPAPLAWLLSNLSMPTPLTNNPAFSSWWSNACASAESSTHAIATYNHRRGRPMLSLSPGCSAFIGIVDPRLRQFSNDSVTRDPSVLIKEEVLNRVLRAKFLKHSAPVKNKANQDQRKRDAAYASFHYIFGRLPELRGYGSAIPSNIFSDALLNEINAKFIKIISEAD